MSRRLLAAAVTGAAVIATGVALTPSAGLAEPSAAPITLQAPEKMVAYSYDGRTWTNLGMRLVASTAQPFEIYSHRVAWDQPIVSVWRRDPADLTDDVTLPAGTLKSFRGIGRFAHVTITSVRTGEVVKEMSLRACFNGYGNKTTPDAPFENPYPTSCPYHPFTKGSVMGIQAGWASSLMPEYGRGLRIGTGRFDVTTTVRPRIADLFEMTPEGSTATTRLVVKEEESFWRARQTAPRATAPDLEPASDEEPVGAQGNAVTPQYAPDLQALPAFDIGINPAGTLLRFGANVWNGGEGPVVIDGYRDAGEDHMTAYQYFLDPDGHQAGSYEQVGQFHFHGANHQHWHFGDFARYRLLKKDSATGEFTNVVKSRKASFCLANTDAVDYTVPNADWRPGNTDLSSACGGPEAVSLREVLSNGSGDTYHQYRAGQAFRIGDVPDGVYYVSVESNPDDRNGRNLIETDYTNNDSLRKVRITTNRHGNRVVRVPRLGIINEGTGGGLFR